MTKAKETMGEAVMDNAEWFGDEVMKAGRNTYLFGLGAMAAAEEEMRAMFDRMVHKGEDIDKDPKTVVGKAKHRAIEFGEMVEDRVQSTMSATLNRAGIPSRDEIRTLIHRVEKLTEKVDRLAAR